MKSSVNKKVIVVIMVLIILIAINLSVSRNKSMQGLEITNRHLTKAKLDYDIIEK